MVETVPILIAVIAFIFVTAGVYLAGRYMASQSAINRRLTVPVAAAFGASATENAPPSFLLASLASKVDEKRFGIEGVLRAKFRRDLIRAGYFSDEAIRYYIIARIGLVLVLPIITFIFAETFMAKFSFGLILLPVCLSVGIALLGPGAYVARRQGQLQQEYRIVFPDLIDMIVVCIDAGLSLDAAFARIRPEISKKSHALAINLSLLSVETRAGRSTADAIGTFADRLNLDEARTFALMLRQSLELGSDVANAMRVFSDEMRAKRLLRAEETANKLPVKMVIPLGLFIFPVILMVIMVPIFIKLLSVFSQVGH
ncbi:MAG TPA: type II secretion system F family protein [Patescibacteria group bacterium]|nr:type II secretion system F family protein [Patescibacteria group bacterium]